MSDSPTLGPPAQRPCESCPYRRDVPSGVWAYDEYEKLRQYDAPTWMQPERLFQCHQTDPSSDRSRICAGWAGCHDAENLLSLRMGLARRQIDGPTFETTVDYVSPVPLFGSGAEAADHGQAQISRPGIEAARAIEKIRRVRGSSLSVHWRDTNG